MPGLRGVLGDLVFSQLPDGPVVRRRSMVRVPPTPAKAAQQARMALVSRAWARLPPSTFREWQAYAASQAWRNPATGAVVVPRAYNLYAGLASRARQVDPTLDPTTFAPPERAFTGDSVIVGVGGGGTLSAPTLPSPTGVGEAFVRFSADRANAPGVVTELLAQPLANAYRRSYKDRYASAGFHAFPAAGTFEVSVRAGAVALAYRFVLAATGQETALVELGTFVVGAAG